MLMSSFRDVVAGLWLASSIGFLLLILFHRNVQWGAIFDPKTTSGRVVLWPSLLFTVVTAFLHPINWKPFGIHVDLQMIAMLYFLIALWIRGCQVFTAPRRGI